MGFPYISIHDNKRGHVGLTNHKKEEILRKSEIKRRTYK
jgi:hypothetical protein